MLVVYIHVHVDVVMVVEVGVVIAAIVLPAGGVSSAAELLHERYKCPETGSVQVSNVNSLPPPPLPPVPHPSSTDCSGLLHNAVGCTHSWP